MLKALFSSNTRVKLLIAFLSTPGEEFFIRELTRKLNEQINSIRRELNNLKKIGLLKSRSKNRKKYYYVNEDFLILDELRSMVNKSTDPKKELIKKLQKLGNLWLVIFSGVFVDKKDKPLDFLVIGDISKQDLSDFFASEAKEYRDVKFGILSKDDFMYRLRLNDKFIVDMLKDPDNIIGLNKLKGPLNKIVS
ncbi:MAG: winged helix-turn-helix domain-containing protein [bacterium]|nr:winged helix-turn-helix domain-containing protein [bacterium]